MSASAGGPSHRIGRRTQLIEPPSGPRAPLIELISAASDPERSADAAASATLIVRTPTGQEVLTISQASRLRPDDLLPTRRPASYRGMRNVIGRACVPSAFGPSAVWFESLNERNHIRDMLLTTAVVGLATQPALVVWTLPGGLRRHFPDMLVRFRSGSIMACDVTRANKLTKPAALAQFTLMAATAHAIGWDFEVRTEMPAQRVRNQSHVHACRHAGAGDRERWIASVSDGPPTATLGEFASRCGGGPAGMGAALHLISQGELSIDFDEVLSTESLVWREKTRAVEHAWVRRL